MEKQQYVPGENNTKGFWHFRNQTTTITYSEIALVVER
jgi:hypothetical protein